MIVKKALLLFMLLIVAAAPLRAEIDTFDRVPAATLLLPYFEIDLSQPDIVEHTFTVGNAGNAPVIAHVTLWTDRGVPTQTFDIALAAHDVKTVDLGQLFWHGLFPQTTTNAFASCSATLPPAPLSASGLLALQNAHQGLASSLLSGSCGGKNFSDNRARGFATIDVTNACTTATPKTPNYFVNGGNGIARNDNVLWGEYATYIHTPAMAYGDALVPLEASASDPNTNNDAPEDYTFYRRIRGDAADNREALPQTWSARFANSGTFTHTRAIVWRDPGPQTSFPCAAQPTGIGTTQVVAFDEEENPSLSCTSRLELAAQSVNLADTVEVDVPFERGYIYYNLTSVSTIAPPVASEAPLADRRQSYVTHVLRTDTTAGQIAGSALGGINENLPVLYLSCGECADGVDNDGDGLIDASADPGCRGSVFGVERPACSDGVDNDLDGLVDYPNDPQCWGPYDRWEEHFHLPPDDHPNPQCDDGVDNDQDGFIDWMTDPDCNRNPAVFIENWRACRNGLDDDGDGLIDYPADPNCISLDDTSEQVLQCADGIDNDGDGKIDFGSGANNDTGCDSTEDNVEQNEACRDGIDNDGDGNIDYPSDTGCSGSNDLDETNPLCNDGIDNDGDLKIDFPADPGCANAASNTESPQCNDGIDDDGDLKIDFPADPGCLSASDNQEADEPQCSDGHDNNGDGKADYPNDQGCTEPFDNFEGPDCSDGFDNDADGLADAADPGCSSPNDFSEFAGTTSRGCSDGIDNDGDGLRDYPADPGCSSRWDDIEGTAAAAAPSATIPTLSSLGLVLAAAILAMVAALALRS
jgi:hypothetical protein